MTQGIEVRSKEDEKLLRRLAVVIGGDGAMYGNGTLQTARNVIDFLNAAPSYAILTKISVENAEIWMDAKGGVWGCCGGVVKRKEPTE